VSELVLELSGDDINLLIGHRPGYCSAGAG